MDIENSGKMTVAANIYSATIRIPEPSKLEETLNMTLLTLSFTDEKVMAHRGELTPVEPRGH